MQLLCVYTGGSNIQQMEAIKCKMCGSTELVEQDGYFVCQHCGTRHTREEAPSRSHTDGTRKESLYTLARRYYKAGNYESAKKAYSELLKADASNWEPMFFDSLLAIIHGKWTDVDEHIDKFIRMTPFIIDAATRGADTGNREGAEVDAAIKTIADETARISARLYKPRLKQFVDVTINPYFTDQAFADDEDMELDADDEKLAELLYVLGDRIDAVGHERYKQITCDLWSRANVYSRSADLYRGTQNNVGKVMEYGKRMKAYGLHDVCADAMSRAEKQIASERQEVAAKKKRKKVSENIMALVFYAIILVTLCIMCSSTHG